MTAYSHTIHEIDFAADGTYRVCMTTRAEQGGVQVGSEIVWVHFDHDGEPVTANRSRFGPEVTRWTEQLPSTWVDPCTQAARAAVYA